MNSDTREKTPRVFSTEGSFFGFRFPFPQFSVSAKSTCPWRNLATFSFGTFVVGDFLVRYFRDTWRCYRYLAPLEVLFVMKSTRRWRYVSVNFRVFCIIIVLRVRATLHIEMFSTRTCRTLPTMLSTGKLLYIFHIFRWDTLDTRIVVGSKAVETLRWVEAVINALRCTRSQWPSTSKPAKGTATYKIKCRGKAYIRVELIKYQ